jgi:hypothetical protein
MALVPRKPAQQLGAVVRYFGAGCDNLSGIALPWNPS